MGTIMIFLRMRRPGADGARREPARMGRRRASRRRVDVGRDVRRRDRAVRVVLDAMLAAQERARDLAIMIVEAALRRRRRRRGPVAARHVRRDLLQQTQAAVRERVEGPRPEEPRRLQLFGPLDRGGARRVVLPQCGEDGRTGNGRARAHEPQVAARRARVRERRGLESSLRNSNKNEEKANMASPSTPGVLRRVGDAPDGSAAIPPGFRPAPARAAERRGVSTTTTIMFKASREPPRQ